MLPARSHIFLLSPAYCGGQRATYLLRPQSTLPISARLRSQQLSLGEAFSFMSGLYFRAKLGYAVAFGRPPTPALVITPTRGLLSPASIASEELLREFGTVDVSADDARYRRPLDAAVQELAQSMSDDTDVVLLGSIATGKYVDVLSAEFGDRLLFPVDFVGRGDMSRGGLMLRSIASREPLAYTALSPHVARHGARPPKLAPMARP